MRMQVRAFRATMVGVSVTLECVSLKAGEDLAAFIDVTFEAR